MRWAILLLLALPAWADGFGPYVLGNDDGIYRPNVGTVAATLTIAAMPFTRTVTCSTYTLTGTSSGSGAVSWSASPSGASGACTGTSSWSCVVDVDPDAVGEGVEVITVTRGSATDTETIGFYVDGEHSCFLAQNVNGSYNVGLANADPVATWVNLGSSGLNVTQGTGAAQPSFRTSVVGGQPVVRCDGGDGLAASTAANWSFLNDGTDWTAAYVKRNTLALSAHVISTRSNGGAGETGSYVGDLTSTGIVSLISNAGVNNILVNTGTANTINVFHSVSHTLDDDGGGGVDFTVLLDNAAFATATRAGSYSGASPTNPLTLCKPGSGGGLLLTGDLFRVHIYQSALTSTQRGINKAVDEWALGASLPVTP